MLNMTADRLAIPQTQKIGRAYRIFTL